MNSRDWYLKIVRIENDIGKSSANWDVAIYLKPCPICQSKNVDDGSHFNKAEYRIICKDCGLQTKANSKLEKRVKYWNSREIKNNQEKVEIIIKPDWLYEF